MKLAGLFLLVAGWAIAVGAVALLPSAGGRVGFVLAGIALEFLEIEEYETRGSILAGCGMGDCGWRRRTAAIGRWARRIRAGRHSGRVLRARAGCPCSSGPAGGRRVTPFVAPSLLTLSEVSAVFCLLLILLVPFAGAALALI